MGSERRRNARLIKRVPVQILSAGKTPAQTKPAEAMNISKDGLYFATDLDLRNGAQLELRFKVPDEIKTLPPLECRFVGRVTHIEPLGPNGKSGVGIHFLYYSLD